MDDSSFNMNRAVEQVQLYAVDEAGYDTLDGKAPDPLGLNPDVFCRHLYCPRSYRENEIMRLLTTHPYNPVWVIGSMGTGKTSLMHKLAEDIRGPRKGLVFTVDFKRMPDLPSRTADRGDAGLRESIHEELRRHLRALIFQFIDQEDIPWLELAQTMISKSATARHVGPEIAEAREQVRLRYDQDRLRFGEQGGVNAWLRERLASPPDEAHAPVHEVPERLLQDISLSSLVFGLVEHLQPANHLAVIIFDNLDSVRTHEMRDALRDAMREFQKFAGDYAQLVVCVRHANEAVYRPEVNPDHGARLYTPVVIDWKAEDPLPDSQEEGFDCDRSVLQKRMAYLRRCIDEGRIKNVDTGKLQVLEARCATIGKHPHIAQDMEALTNGDRRRSAILVTNFIEYLDENTFPFHELETRPNASLTHSELGYIMESAFFRFMVGKSEANWKYPRVFDVGLYNMAQWVADRQSGRSAWQCMVTHLILAAIYKASGAKRFAPCHKRVSVNQLWTICRMVDLQDSEVTGWIKRFSGGDPLYAALCETSRDHTMSENDIVTGDTVSLMPRGQALLDVVGHKFHYVMALMDRQQIRLNGRPFVYEDASPLTTQSVNSALEFIRQLWAMEIEALHFVQNRRSGSSAMWLDDFRDAFCIQISNLGRFSDGRGNLLADNLLGSCIKYLDTLHKGRYLQEAISADMVREFQKEQEKLHAVLDQFMTA